MADKQPAVPHRLDLSGMDRAAILVKVAPRLHCFELQLHCFELQLSHLIRWLPCGDSQIGKGAQVPHYVAESWRAAAERGGQGSELARIRLAPPQASLGTPSLLPEMLLPKCCSIIKMITVIEPTTLHTLTLQPAFHCITAS